MEFKSLLLGILFSIGIFAIKSGVGLNYFFQRKKKLKIKLAVLLFYVGGYLIIFLGVFYSLQHLNLLQHFEIIRNMMKSGMLIHVIMATFMAIYGFMLLKRPPNETAATSGWLILVLPCPVCLVVILFSVAFMLAYFPEAGKTAVLTTYAGFLLINFLTVILMNAWSVGSRSTPETILGAAMLMISTYFLLSIIIMPQFSDIDKIYRLALYKGENPAISATSVWVLSTVIITAFIIGFASATRTIRRIQN